MRNPKPRVSKSANDMSTILPLTEQVPNFQVPRALRTVLICAVVGAVLGLLVGAGLGIWAPGYYRAVFRDGFSPDFHPLQVGVGLGLTQGLGTGIVVGLLVVIGRHWTGWRTIRQSLEAESQAAVRSARVWLWGGALVVLMAMCSVVPFIAGGIVGQSQLYANLSAYKIRKLETVLNDREFRNVFPEQTSSGGVSLSGTVSSPEQLERLHRLVKEEFGRGESEEMLRGVTVRAE